MMSRFSGEIEMILSSPFPEAGKMKNAPLALAIDSRNLSARDCKSLRIRKADVRERVSPLTDFQDLAAQLILYLEKLS